MATPITDPLTEEQVRAQRAATGADLYDEVWDGVYVVAPFRTTSTRRLSPS
jgi:hypothetical protein